MRKWSHIEGHPPPEDFAAILLSLQFSPHGACTGEPGGVLLDSNKSLACLRDGPGGQLKIQLVVNLT